MKEVELYTNATGGPGFLGKIFVRDNPKVVVWKNRFFILMEESDKVYLETTGYLAPDFIKTAEKTADDGN